MKGFIEPRSVLFDCALMGVGTVTIVALVYAFLAVGLDAIDAMLGAAIKTLVG